MVNAMPKFQNGTVLSRAEREERFLVLDFNEDAKIYTLMRLPDGEGKTFTLDEYEIRGLDDAYLPGPRFVQVRLKGSDDILGSTYVPDMKSAVSVWRELEDREDAKYNVRIFTQHIDENEWLSRIDYYKPPEDMPTENA